MVNNHLPHLEDLLFEGEPGYRKILRVLSYLKDNNFSNFTYKIDGAPAVFVGTDPNDGQKFVAKKSIFNKTPIIYKNYDQIDQHINNPELANKLKKCLDVLPKIDGCLQGDLIFSEKHELKHVKLDYADYVRIHPNTIQYNVNVRSDLFRALECADIGFIDHTFYLVDKGLTLRRENSYEYPRTSEVFTFDKKITPFVNIEFDLDIPEFIDPEHDTKYYNSFIRKNEEFAVNSKFDELYIHVMQTKDSILDKIHWAELDNLYMRKTVQIGDRFIDVAHEGIVYVDDDFSCKLVDRRSFSYYNFSSEIVKGWNL